MGKTLVLFDFDGTLTYGDSFLRFIHYYCGKKKYYSRWLFLLFAYILFIARFVKDSRLKEWVLMLYLRNEPFEALRQKAESYSRDVLQKLLRPAALRCLENHKKLGHTIYVVSASARLWLEPWCRKQGIGLIATHLAFNNGKLTGHLKTPNCKGKEKVNRIREELNLQEYDHIIAYGDSRGDLPMLSLADESHYKPFRKKKGLFKR